MTESPLPWPGYRAAPDRLNLAGVVLDSANAGDAGHHPALIGEFDVVTYAELRRRVDSVGAALVDLIVEESHTCYRGDRAHRHAWGYGCGECPACELRAAGWAEWIGSR